MHFLFEFISKSSVLYGERYLVQGDTKDKAEQTLNKYYPNEKHIYLGKYTDEEVETMDYD